MERKLYPKSLTGQDTRSLGSPFVHTERDPAANGLRRVDEVVLYIIKIILTNINV